MEVLTQENNTGAITRKFVRSGVAGNYEIVYEMIRVIRNSVNYDIGLEHFTKQLLTSHNLDSHSPQIDQLQMVFDFVRSNIKYTLDKAGLIESIKSARTTIADGYGDCDDLTNTIASMTGLLGFEDVRIAMARYSENDTAFSHVYPVIYTTDKKRIPMDASLPDAKLGREVKAIEIKEISVFQDVKGLDGIGGLFNNLLHSGKKLGRVAVDLVPQAAFYLPLGFVSSHALATGAQLLNHTAGKELSLNATASKINKELDKIIVDLIRSRIALDMAKPQALQFASQLSAVEKGRDDLEIYNTVKSSIQKRLEFISNFEAFAKMHNIKVVYLNPSAMLATGLAGAGFGCYMLYKVWDNKRGN